MRRSSSWICVLIAGCGFVLPAFAQSNLTPAQKLQQLQQLRQAARDAAKSAAANQPPPPPPPPTVTVRPTATIATTRPTATVAPPPPTVVVTVRTAAPPPPPPPTVTAVASVAPSASAPHPRPVDPARLAAVTADNLEKLRRTRPDRRHTDTGRLQQRWGNLLSDGRAQAELKLHAEHMAYLQRIRSLAQNANDAKSVESVDILISQEERRDADVMNSLRSGAPSINTAGAK